MTNKTALIINIARVSTAPVSSEFLSESEVSMTKLTGQKKQKVLTKKFV